MSLLSSFDIGATGLSAQALRLNLTASNIANVESVSGPDGRTYRARHVEFSAINKPNAPGAGVAVTKIYESDSPFRRQYSPGHPKADALVSCGLLAVTGSYTRKLVSGLVLAIFLFLFLLICQDLRF